MKVYGNLHLKREVYFFEFEFACMAYRKAILLVLDSFTHFSSFGPCTAMEDAPFPDIRVFHDRPILCISVSLSDRSKVTQHKINFVKNCPQ